MLFAFVFICKQYYNNPMATTNRFQKAEQIFQAHHGLLRTAEAIRLGIAPATLYTLRDTGAIVQESRGLYRLADVMLERAPDLIRVSQRVPNGVICLISALDFHELTTQIPHQVYLALPRRSRIPQLDYPALAVVRLSEPAYSAGIEVHKLDGFPVKVYSPEKTLADCLKFRNKIGLDVALEALKTYMNRAGIQIEMLLHYARVDRVESLMQRYLEILV